MSTEPDARMPGRTRTRTCRPAARALAAKRSRSAAEDGELRAALNFGVAAGGLHVGDVVDRGARTHDGAPGQGI